MAEETGRADPDQQIAEAMAAERESLSWWRRRPGQAHRTSLWRRTAPGRWQVFHHQGTIAIR